MKRVLCLLLMVIMILSAVPAFANTQDFDFSGLSFDELIAVQEQLTAAIWASDGWQEVTVPAGIYQIGDEIPEGRWCISPAPSESYVYIVLGSGVDESGSSIPYESESSYEYLGSDYTHQVIWNLVDGCYLYIKDGSVVFTPATGALGFNSKNGNSTSNSAPTSKPESTATPKPTATPTPKPTATSTPKPTKKLTNYSKEDCKNIALNTLKGKLKNPNSLQVHSISIDGKEGDSSFGFEIDFSAMNSLGGYNRQTFFCLVDANTGRTSMVTII